MKESIYIEWHKDRWVAVKNSQFIFENENVEDVIEYLVKENINQNCWIKIENKFGTLREVIPFTQ